MTKTGVIRRIDELGRLVIPKELRRSLRLQENDPLELSISEDEGGRYLIATPYSPLDCLPVSAGRILNGIFPKLKGASLTLKLSDAFTTSSRGAGAKIEAAAIFKQVRDSGYAQSGHIMDDTHYLALPVRRGEEIIAALILVGPSDEIEENRAILEMAASILDATL